MKLAPLQTFTIRSQNINIRRVNIRTRCSIVLLIIKKLSSIKNGQILKMESHKER